jgi:hypothetical protein
MPLPAAATSSSLPWPCHCLHKWGAFLVESQGETSKKKNIRQPNFHKIFFFLLLNFFVEANSRLFFNDCKIYAHSTSYRGCSYNKGFNTSCTHMGMQTTKTSFLIENQYQRAKNRFDSAYRIRSHKMIKYGVWNEGPRYSRWLVQCIVPIQRSMYRRYIGVSDRFIDINFALS